MAREFTTAHLRSTILGAFVANIYEAMGWDVVRINYLGDWGKHLGLLGVGWQKYGSEMSLDEQSHFRYIHDLYIKMENELQPEQEARRKARDDGQDSTILEDQGLFADRDTTFKRMEDREPDAIVLWQQLRDISIEYYISMYSRLNVKFDEYSGESRVSLGSEAITEVETLLKEKRIYEERDGAWVIDFDKHGKSMKLGTATVRSRNGSTTYLLRDIASVFDRFKRHSFDKMLYVACEQDVHFRQVFRAVELMGFADISEKLQHITFPKASGPSPHGKAQLLGNILDQCENHMSKAMSDNPDEYQFEDSDAAGKVIGINFLIIHELSQKKNQNIGIDFNFMASSEGETGISLHMCYSRLSTTILRNGVYLSSEDIYHVDYSSLWKEPWCELLRLIARYPDITNSAFKTLEPGTILSYLFRIVEELTYCLDNAEEDGSGGEGSAAAAKHAARAFLYESVRQVLRNAMKLLGAVPFNE
jgi:arginyl-tRNA synthetase